MKTRTREQKCLFTLLIAASLIAICVGGYLGIALGTLMPGLTRVLPVLGIALWVVAWGEFLAMCLRLRKGASAFTASTGKTLGVIGGCLAGLAAVAFISALAAGNRAEGFLIIERVLLPGFFLAAAAAAKLLQGLLIHAMAIEKEQEGVV